MKNRNIIGAIIVSLGVTFGLGAVQAPESKTEAPGQATQELRAYRNAKNEICEMVEGKVECKSEKARDYEKAQEQRREQSRREYFHDVIQ